AAGGDTGSRRVSGTGAGGRDGPRGLLGRRGRRLAARDEPQAERGGDRGLPRPLRRRRGPKRGRRRDREPRLRQARRLLGLRLPQVPRGGVRAARLPVDVVAAPSPTRVPRGAAERAADGLLSAGIAGAGCATAWGGGAAGRRQPQRGEVRARGRRGADRARVRAIAWRTRSEGRRRAARAWRTVRRSARVGATGRARPRPALGARRFWRLRRVRRAAPAALGARA